MNIELTDKNCIFVELTGDDLKSYDITYEQIEYKDEKTRSMLNSILEKAKHETKCENSFKNKLQIELLPGIPDGCLIIFKALSHCDANMIFETDNADNLFDCANALSAVCKNINSTLYAGSCAYRLAIHNCNEKILSVIGEFLTPLGGDSLEESRTAEYMRCLISNNALEILCSKRAHL